MCRDIFTDEFGKTGTLDDGDSTNNDSINLCVFYDDIWELYADQADDGVLKARVMEGCRKVHYAI